MYGVLDNLKVHVHPKKRFIGQTGAFLSKTLVVSNGSPSALRVDQPSDSPPLGRAWAAPIECSAGPVH